MGSHIQMFAPGVGVTFTAMGEVAGGQALEVSGDRCVRVAAVDSSSVIGVAATDAAEGDSVLVLRGGVQVLAVSAPVEAGDRVGVAVGGDAKPVEAGGFGMALTSASAGGRAQIAMDGN